MQLPLWKGIPVPIHHFQSVDEARALLTGQEDRLISWLPEPDLLKQAAKVKAGVFDFCGTLAVGSQWKEMKTFLCPFLRAEDDRDRDWYLNHTQDEDTGGVLLNDPDWFMKHGVHENRAAIEGAWLARSMQRFKDGDMEARFFKEAGERCRMRQGVRDLFDLLSPRVVISMGVEQTIRACLAHNGLEAAVAATRIEFDQDGIMNGYNPNVVVSSSKGAALAQFRRLTRLSLDEYLVIGDSFIDVEMMPEGAFNILIVPHTEDFSGIANFREIHLEAMLKKVTLVLYSNSLTPLVQLMHEAHETA